MKYKKLSSLIAKLDKEVSSLPMSKRAFAIKAGFGECSGLRKILAQRKGKYETLQAFFDTLGYDLHFTLTKKKAQ